MGNNHSKEEEEIMNSAILHTAESHGVTPDITIDGSLLMYSGLNSTAVLEQHSSEMVSDLVTKFPDYLTALGSSLSAFKHVPNAVGLGALVISFVLDLTLIYFGNVPEDSPLNMMRRIFAEEKASGVRDSMDECLKRLQKYVQEPQEALKETKRLEKQLSEQLTRLRNSMLKDDQMSSRAMKIWTNGAAFHVQMIIHEARLMMAGYGSKEEKNLDIRVASVCRMVDYYRKDLEDLLDKYKSYKRTNMRLSNIEGVYPYFPSLCRVYDNEIGKTTPVIFLRHFTTLDAYINYMFSNWDQIKKLNEYFTVLRTNIKELISQNRTFTMENV